MEARATKQETAFMKYLKAYPLKRKSGVKTGSSPYHLRLPVDGDDDKTTIKSFVENQILAQDSRALRNYIKDLSPNIEGELQALIELRAFISNPVSVNYKKLLEEYKKSKFVYLANNDPEQNTSLIKEFDNVKFSMCDTIDFWINTKRASVVKMFKEVDAVVINDEEAKLLTKEFNLIKCAKKIMNWGTKYVIIKKAEHGSLLFFEDVIFSSPGFSLENIVDPTGAGDSFAGAMIGYLASKKKTNLSSIKESVIYGNVMGSFAVQKYGLGGLLKLTKADIAKRVKQYEKTVSF